MIKYWNEKKHRGILQVIAVALVGSFMFSVIAPPFAQASIWEERRETLKKLRGGTGRQGSEVPKRRPQGNASLDTTLLARLPGVQLPGRLSTIGQGNQNYLYPALEFARQNLPPITHNLPLNLPLAFSNFKSAQFPPNWKPGDLTIIHIQDVHMNHEVQQNIGKSIQLMIDQGKLDLVALEGAFKKR